jgi:hypothetical protein
MRKKISLLIVAVIAGALLSILQPIKLKSLGHETLNSEAPNISVTDAEIVEETDNSLTIRYHLRNAVEGVHISACGDVYYANDGYAWGCKPVIIPAYAGTIDITYLLASTARSIECSDSVGIRLYIGSGFSFYRHLFAYEKVWHKNPGTESWTTYNERGCEPPRPLSELLRL